MEERACFSCGRVLAPGALAYRVTARFVADYDGVITEDPELIDMYAVLEECLALDAETLENDVHQEITITLCKACKDATVARLLRDKKGKPEPELPIDL